MTIGAPLKIAPLSPVSCGSMVCRTDGARAVVVAVKATFTLRHEAFAALALPEKLVVADRFGDNPEAGSHFAARELVPFLPSPGAIVYGHARAPAGTWITSSMVRFCLYRPDRMLCDKRIVIVGDCSPQGSPRPWSVLPLVHERAFGGPGVAQNPLGTGAAEGSRAPNLLDPTDPRRPACFAPIPPGWPARLQHLRGWDIRSLDQPIVEIPRGFAMEYFHPAPRDQWFEGLRGDEWILLEGMVPDHPTLTSRLPSAHALARLHRRTPRGWVLEQPFSLAADLLGVDADRATVSLVFRGRIPLERDEDLHGACLYVGLEQAGDPITWPDADDLAAAHEQLVPEPKTPLSAPSRLGMASLGEEETVYIVKPARPPPPSSVDPADQTQTLSLSALRAGLQKAIAPFEISPPSTSASNVVIPGAPWAPPQPPSIATPAVVDEERTINETSRIPSMGRPGPTAALPFVPAPEPPAGTWAPRPPPLSGPSALPFSASSALPFVAAPGSLSVSKTEIPPRVATSPEPPPLVVPSPEPPPLVVPSPEPPPLVVPSPEPPPLVVAPPALARSIWVLNARPLAYAPPTGESAPSGASGAAPDDIASPALTTSEPPVEAAAAPEPLDTEPAPLAAPEPGGTGVQPATLPTSGTPPAVSEPAIREAPHAETKAPPGAEGTGNTLRDIIEDRLKRDLSLSDLPFEFSDLSGVDLRGANLAGVRLRGAILRGVSLTSARLTSADLSGADLSGADLRDAVADGADFTRAKLDGAVFSGASLVDANLTGCHGARVDFTEARLSGADLRQARLAGSDMAGADLHSATCAKADLSGASLARADLTGAVLRSCRLKGADLTMARLAATDLRDADLEQANLHGVDRSGAKLAGASLKGVVEEPPA